MNATLEAALEFADRGWPVLPVHTVTDEGFCSCGRRDCHAPGKHPVTRHGYQDATTEREKLKSWFSSSRYNIAIATGSKFCALDLDDDTESAWVMADYITGGIPYTLSARTRRGFHFYFVCEDVQVPTKVLSLSPHIELIGLGKYVIVPPSQFKTWLNLTDPVPIPARIVQIPACRERRPGIATVARGVDEGCRNVSAAAVAGKLLGSFPERDWHFAWSLLEAWNDKNRPPLPKKELKRVFDKIAKRELQKRTRQLNKEAQLIRALAVALEHSNLSQRQLAKLSHVPQPVLSRLLNSLACRTRYCTPKEASPR